MKTEATLSPEQMAAEMVVIVRRIRALQAEHGWSTARLIQEQPLLGSAKTWTDRLMPETFAGLDIPRWHRQLLRIGSILDGGTPDEEYFRDMPFCREMLARLLQLERQQSDRRILACLAANGTGKSLFARWAVAQSRTTRCLVRMRSGWRNKILHICCGIARALGDAGNYTNPAVAEDAVIKLLSGNPVTVFIDQAHEGGVRLMDLLREFVDETPSRFVYLAYETTYRQVISASTDAMLEAQAFIGRCAKPVFDRYRFGVLPDDVATYLSSAAGFSAAASKALAGKITAPLQRHTNLRLLDDAISAARAASGQDNPPPDVVREQVFVKSGLDPKQFATESDE